MLSERIDSKNYSPPGISSILAAVLLVLLFSWSGFADTPNAARQSLDSPSLDSPTYDAESFARELGRLKSELEISRESSDKLHELTASLPDKWNVKIGLQQYEVPTSLLVNRLTKAEKSPEVRQLELNRARDYLDALAAESSSLSALPPQADTSSAKTALDRILARPEYAHNRQQSWWDRIRAQINQMIFDALTRMFSRLGAQKSLGEVLLWLGICAAVVLTAYLVFRRWFHAARLAEMAIQSTAFPARTWQQWIFAARSAAERRDYRFAIHCAYWGGIARLEDLGTISSDGAKTPREYLRSLAKSKLIVPETYAARYQALSAMTSRLERTWYGYRTATEADFRDSLAQLEILGCHLP